MSAHDSEENAHLLTFHFSELPQLFGAKGWVQPLSHDEISNVKRIYDMCQLNMSFKVACTPPQLQFLEWIVRRVRVHSIASFEQAPRSWYGGAGSVVIQQQDFTTPALPLSSSEPQPRHRSRSQSSVSNYSKHLVSYFSERSTHKAQGNDDFLTVMMMPCSVLLQGPL